MQAGLKPLSAAAPLRLSEWAAEHFYLSKESSYVEQAWKAYPFQTAIMDCISNDEIQEVDFIKSARVGYTKMILAAIGYFAEHKRRNQAIWQPTDDDSDEFCKTELEPMFRDVPVMEEVFPAYQLRHKHNTLKQKVGLGVMLHLRGGKAAKNYRRLSVDVVYLDELDGFDNDVEKEGSPVTLAGKRVEGATFPKQVRGSTPKLKGFSMIEARSDQAEHLFRYHIPCPHCGEEITLQWGGKDKSYGFKWTNDDADSVVHHCDRCSVGFTQGEYLDVWERGRWISEDGTWIDPQGDFRNIDGDQIPPPLSVAMHIWTAYSPQTGWPKIVREFQAAQAKAKAGDKSELKSFVNTTLGETWEEEVEKTDENELMRRAEDFPLRKVPIGGLVLVAGADVQGNRFEVTLWAIGRGEEMWTVDYHVIDANPADEREWDEKLLPYLESSFPHAAGGALRIEASAIDTGGHFTHQCYNFCRRHKKMHAIKGDTRQGRPVKGRSSLQDVNWRGKVIKRGVKLWMVGTDTAKDLIFGRLKVTQPGPGYIHFSKELPPDFYSQLTAEVRVLQKTASGEQYRWIKKVSSGRNEVLDCTVYAIFISHLLDLHRYTDRMWEKLAQAVQPPVGDLFSDANKHQTKPAPKDAPIASNRTKPRRSGGFATSWKR